MRSRNISVHLTIGLLIGLFIIPASPTQAQWAVFDPTQYALQVQKKLEEAIRWFETVKHYATMVDKTLQQLSTMQGVLRNVDEQHQESGGSAERAHRIRGTNVAAADFADVDSPGATQPIAGGDGTDQVRNQRAPDEDDDRHARDSRPKR